MCYWGDSNFQDAMRSIDFDGGPMKRKMPTDMALRLIDAASKLGVPSMKFHGRGDGIHHNDYSKIVQYARAKGTFLELLVNTHGNCGPDKIDGLMAADKVMISLDSTDVYTYEKMRAGGRLSKVIWTVAELLRRGHQNVWVRRVITDFNNTETFVENCKKIFGPSIKVSEHFAMNKRNAQRTSAIHGEDESEWPRQYCTYPSVRLMVLASGLVLPCCADWRAELVVGDINKQSLQEIWDGETIKNLRRELRGNLLRADTCKNCSSFMSYDRKERFFVQDREGSARLNGV